MAIFLNHWYLRRYLIVTPKTHCLAARPAIAVQQAAVGGLAQWTKKPACTFHMLEISFPILSRASYWCLPCFVWSLNPDVTGNWHHTLPLVVPPLGGPCKVVQLKWTIPNNMFIKRGEKWVTRDESLGESSPIWRGLTLPWCCHFLIQLSNEIFIKLQRILAAWFALLACTSMEWHWSS